MANISSYNQLSSWNEDDDLLFVQQPDAPKKAHPSQMKQYILEGLDVSSVGGTGKYISAISEADGKISATAETMDAAPTEGSLKAVTSGGIKTAIDDSVSLKTATGNPITLTDAANANAEKLLMTIEPIQSGSGDPSPTNVRPISGISEAVVTRTGENLIDESALIAAVLDPTTGQPSASTEIKITPMISIKSSVSYLFAHQNNEPFRIFAYTADGTFIERTDIYWGDAVVTTGETWAYVRVQASGSAWIATDPILAQTVDITIQLGQTVYGGTVNFKTGEVTVTHKSVTFVGADSENWRLGGFSGNEIFIIDLVDIKQTQSITDIFTGKSDKLKTVSFQELYDTPNVFCAAGSTNTNLYCKFGSNVTLAAVKAWLSINHLQLCYELATPVTLTLTPAELELLKGNNTITANGVEISIEYYPDNAIGALAGRVDDKADITYVDNAVDGVVKHVAGKLSITIPLSDSWTASIFGTISATPISAILTVVSGGSVSVTDLTSNSLASRADISVSVSDKTITLTSKNTDKFYVNIVY